MKTIVLAAIIALSAFAAEHMHAYKTRYTTHFLVCPKGMHQEVYIDLNSPGRPIERCEKDEKRKK